MITRLVLTVLAAACTALCVRDVVRSRTEWRSVAGGARRAAWLTGVGLLVTGACTVAWATMHPSETLRPGWAGAAVALQLAALVPAAALCPGTTAKHLRVGAPLLVAAMGAATALTYLVDRAEFDTTTIGPLVIVTVFVAAPSYVAASFLRLPACGLPQATPPAGR